MIAKKLQIEEEKRTGKYREKNKKPKPSLSSYKQNEKAISNIIKMPGISSYSKLPSVSPSPTKTLHFVDNSATNEEGYIFLPTDQSREEAPRIDTEGMSQEDYFDDKKALHPSTDTF
jgi:hypothetical protein